jgi:toxin YhaV
VPPHQGLALSPSGKLGLGRDVERLARQQPEHWQSQPKAKLLRRIVDLIELEIPRDPNAPEYVQGSTLGPSHRHWRRAKFLGRFRLFFRVDSGDVTLAKPNY